VIRSLARVASLVTLLFACKGSEPGEAFVSDWDAATTGAWSLSEIDGRAPIAGTSVTLEIEADGKLAGSAGANRYFGSCERTAAGIAMSPLGSTRMYVAEPPGLMEQEARFLELLGNATALRADSSALVFLVAGEEKLRFARQPDE
jgi:heat shock protein HslJ